VLSEGHEGQRLSMRAVIAFAADWIHDIMAHVAEMMRS
jgi:hypothetical protein